MVTKAIRLHNLSDQLRSMTNIIPPLFRYSIVSILFVVLGIGSSVTAIKAQDATSDTTSSPTISILTCGPGYGLATLFGHTGIRVIDPIQDKDYVFNFGTYNPGQANFATNFLRGRLLYTASVSTMDSFVRAYGGDGRSIQEQIIDLQPEEAVALYQALKTNYLPENREYLYDFYYDNCVTRLRDHIEAVKGTVDWGKDIDPDITMRGLLHSHLAQVPWTRFGMDLILGVTNDGPASPKDQMFLPSYFHDYLEQASINEVPIISRNERLLDFPNVHPPVGFLTPDRFFWVLALIELILLAFFLKRGSIPWIKVWDVLWFGVLFFVFLLFTFMWVATDHHVCSSNYDILWTVPWMVFLPGVFKRIKIRILLLLLTIITCIGILIFWGQIPQELPSAVLPIILISLIKATRLLPISKLKWGAQVQTASSKSLKG